MGAPPDPDRRCSRSRPPSRAAAPTTAPPPSRRPSASRSRSTSRPTPSTPRSTPPRATAATRDQGVELEIRKPGPGPDALKLITAGKVDLGVLDIHDLAIAREQGADLVAIGALVDAPLAALIGQPGLKRPRDLEGRTVGVSGLPSDPAFLRAILEHDGADYDKRQAGHDRLLGGRAAAQPPRRRRARVLERRGRRAEGEGPRRLGVPRRRLRRAAVSRGRARHLAQDARGRARHAAAHAEGDPGGDGRDAGPSPTRAAGRSRRRPSRAT